MLSKKQVYIASQNRVIGQIPTTVARELVKTNHANIVSRKPVVIGLTLTKTRTQPVAKHIINNAVTKRRKINS